jgi:hypothetical protein
MKARIHHWTNQIFKPVKPVSPGLFHYQSPPDSAKPYRMHLRLESDGTGLLVLNASTILHLNQTASEYALYLIQNKSPEEVGELMNSRYRISDFKAREDFSALSNQINSLLETPDLAPDLFFDVERIAPHSKDLSAPYRLDCALTYKSPSRNESNSKGLQNIQRELTTEEWKTVLGKASEAGIPHIIFTGGEPTVRPDLIELIECTEEMELVCGLITDGERLSDPSYLHSILNAGLDHLVILLDDDEGSSWEALKDILSEDIFTTVHLTISEKNSTRVMSILEKLVGLKVASISLSMESLDLKPILMDAQQFCQVNSIPLVWDLPVPFSDCHPIAIELSDHPEYISGAGKAWLFVKPDGTVLPDQGDEHKLGNLLTDEWDSIWKPV